MRKFADYCDDHGAMEIHKGFKCYGWFTRHDKKWYVERASAIHNGTIVEIGVYGGCSLLSIVDICIRNNTTIIGIDVWDRMRDFMGVQGIDPSTMDQVRSNLLMRKNEIYDIIERLQYQQTVVLKQCESLDAAIGFVDDSIDLVFIDANHSEMAVRADIEAWYPKVKMGGVLSGHDYHDDWPGVAKAVDAFVADRGLALSRRRRSSIWEVVRPK